MRVLVVALPALLGCSGAPSRRADCGQPIVGTPADYATPSMPSTITVSPPKLCANGEAYIRIERARGGRKLGTGRSSGGGFDEGCMKLPANPADPADCPTVNFSAILHEASSDLQARHVDGAGGDGLGPCGNASGDYDAWNMATGVRAWRDAPAAVTTVAALLDKYNVAGFVGVSVRGIPCAYAE